MSFRKHSFQFGFDHDSLSSGSSLDDDFSERSRLNPFTDDTDDELHDADPSSPYLIPNSPVSISGHSATFSSRSLSNFYEVEPTDAYPDDDTGPAYNFREHLKQDSTTATRYSRRFKSRLIKGNVEKAWLKEKDPREKWVTILPLIGIFIGCGLAAYLGYSGWASIETHNFCMVYEDDFSTFRNDIWNHEVQVGGFGTGEFEWTTADPANSYVVNNTLVIMPTLTDQVLSDAQISNGYTLNLTTQGTCTSPDWHQCVAISNSTTETVINPVRSARITTKMSRSIKYGKVEVVAKLPMGDWLWPAIWMMPVNDTYGAWPASGEIDIMESRGNPINYPLGGVDSYSSTLHWGIIGTLS
jgi:Glycosyl hydrolases family 16